MADPWDPPDDPTGGYFLLKYENGPQSHKSRWHINAFDAVALTYISPGSREAAIGTTLTNLVAQLVKFWDDGWLISFEGLFQQTSDRVFTPVYPPPIFTPQSGTATDAAALTMAAQTTFNSHTTNGGKMRPTMLANNGWAAADPVICTSATSGRIGEFIAYLVGSDTQIVGHDGGIMIDYVRVTQDENERLRRHYHLD